LNLSFVDEPFVTVGLALLTWFDLKLTCGFEEVFKISLN
jgi:hypothetical protein